MATVSSLWIGDTISKLEKVCIKSFLDRGFSYELYTYEPNTKNLPDRVTLKNANDVVNKDKVFTYKSGFNKGSVSGFANFFRYVLLYKKGGVWVDTDIALLSSDLNFNKPNVFVTEEGSPPNGKFTNALMRAERGFPVLKECIKKFKSINVKHIAHGQTGPDLLSKKLKETGFLQNGKVELKSREHYFPVHWEKSKKLFYDDIDINREWKTIHFWNAWIQNKLELDKNASFPRWSLFERLKEKHLNG